MIDLKLLLARAVFDWWLLCGALFVAYPSEGVVTHVCIAEREGEPSVCRAPSDRVGEVFHVDEVDYVAIRRVVRGEEVWENLGAGPLNHDGLFPPPCRRAKEDDRAEKP